MIELIQTHFEMTSIVFVSLLLISRISAIIMTGGLEKDVPIEKRKNHHISAVIGIISLILAISTLILGLIALF